MANNGISGGPGHPHFGGYVVRACHPPEDVNGIKRQAENVGCAAGTAHVLLNPEIPGLTSSTSHGSERKDSLNWVRFDPDPEAKDSYENARLG